MHPFLAGFWTTVGPTAVLLFVMFFLRDAKGWDWTTFSISSFIPPTLWLLPIAGMAYAWYKAFGPRNECSTRKRNRRLTGAVLGLVVILVSLYALLPLVMQPKPPEAPRTVAAKDG